MEQDLKREDVFPRKTQEEIKKNAALTLEEISGKQRKAKRRRTTIKAAVMCIAVMLAIAGVTFFTLYAINGRIPSTLYVRRGENQEMFFGVPATGEIVAAAGMGQSNIPSGAVTIDMNKKVKMVTGTESSYSMQVKLFGFLPFKQVDIQVVEDRQLTPVGIPVGIYLKTDGLMVVGTGEFENQAGETVSPAKNKLYTGEYILKVNGVAVTKKQELTDAVSACHGKRIELRVRSADAERTEYILPQKDSHGEYKVGIWVRDSAQGIGTVTYVDEEGNFGALGHGISDVDTKELIECTDGTIYKTDIVKVKKGERGAPGELTGRIYYLNENILADVNLNEKKGIFGVARDNADWFEKAGKSSQPVDVAYKQEIRKGPAQILTTLQDVPEYYDVEIVNIYLNNDNVNRGIVLKVTDQRLIEKTGGIVQGMSGSPILQDGKLIGAVTHVFVNDPTKGYGIFIENMIEH